MQTMMISQLKNSANVFGLPLVCFFVVGYFWPVQFAWGQDSAPSAAAGAAPSRSSKSDKLDVSDLEKKYWAAKDTDFNVVQNRTYTKTGRVSLSASYGFLVNDAFSDGPSLGASLNYYFSERYGMELTFVNTSSRNNKSVEAFISRYSVVPDHSKIRDFYGTAFNWVPIYAKMSFLNSKIIYFDMAFSPGIGVTSYEQQIEGGSQGKTAPTLTFDVTQHFFFSNNFAVRFDYKNRWFSEDVAAYRTAGGTAKGATIRTETNQTSLFMLGFEFFY